MGDGRSSSEDFEFLSKLGSGSFGTVHKVRRLADGQSYVVKIVRIAELQRREQEEAINEVRILSAMDSAYVVKYYDSYLETDSLYIVMEFCNRGDLQSLVKKAKSKDLICLKDQVTWNIVLQIILGLHYLHKKKILHRDLKSANVFLHKSKSQSYFNVKIGDLGVAKLLDTSTAFANTIVGTPYYLSPELCADQPYRDKSDVWALGVVLYECCTLAHPFEARNQVALIMKIINSPVPELPTASVPAELAILILALLQKDYAQRPTTKEILCESLVQQKLEEHDFELPEDLRNAPITHRFTRRMSQSRSQSINLTVTATTTTDVDTDDKTSIDMKDNDNDLDKVVTAATDKETTAAASSGSSGSGSGSSSTGRRVAPPPPPKNKSGGGGVGVRGDRIRGGPSKGPVVSHKARERYQVNVPPVSKSSSATGAGAVSKALKGMDAAGKSTDLTSESTDTFENSQSHYYVSPFAASSEVSDALIAAAMARDEEEGHRLRQVSRTQTQFRSAKDTDDKVSWSVEFRGGMELVDEEHEVDGDGDAEEKQQRERYEEDFEPESDEDKDDDGDRGGKGNGSGQVVAREDKAQLPSMDMGLLEEENAVTHRWPQNHSPRHSLNNINNAMSSISSSVSSVPSPRDSRDHNHHQHNNAPTSTSAVLTSPRHQQQQEQQPYSRHMSFKSLPDVNINVNADAESGRVSVDSNVSGSSSELFRSPGKSSPSHSDPDPDSDWKPVWSVGRGKLNASLKKNNNSSINNSNSNSNSNTSPSMTENNEINGIINHREYRHDNNDNADDKENDNEQEEDEDEEEEEEELDVLEYTRNGRDILDEAIEEEITAKLSRSMSLRQQSYDRETYVIVDEVEVEDEEVKKADEKTYDEETYEIETEMEAQKKFEEVRRQQTLLEKLSSDTKKKLMTDLGEDMFIRVYGLLRPLLMNPSLKENGEIQFVDGEAAAEMRNLAKTLQNHMGGSLEKACKVAHNMKMLLSFEFTISQYEYK